MMETKKLLEVEDSFVGLGKIEESTKKLILQFEGTSALVSNLSERFKSELDSISSSKELEEKLNSIDLNIEELEKDNSSMLDQIKEIQEKFKSHVEIFEDHLEEMLDPKDPGRLASLNPPGFLNEEERELWENMQECAKNFKDDPNDREAYKAFDTALLNLHGKIENRVREKAEIGMSKLNDCCKEINTSLTTMKTDIESTKTTAVPTVKKLENLYKQVVDLAKQMHKWCESPWFKAMKFLGFQEYVGKTKNKEAKLQELVDKLEVTKTSGRQSWMKTGKDVIIETKFKTKGIMEGFEYDGYKPRGP